MALTLEEKVNFQLRKEVAIGWNWEASYLIEELEAELKRTDLTEVERQKYLNLI